MEAWEWLNRRAVDQSGHRRLCIEVRILSADDEDGKAKSKIKVQNKQKKASGLLSEAKEEAGEGDVKEAPRTVSRANKRKAAANGSGELEQEEETREKKHKVIGDINQDNSRNADEDEAPVHAAKPKMKPCKALGSLERGKKTITKPTSFSASTDDHL